MNAVKFDRWMMVLLAGLALGLEGLALAANLAGLRPPDPLADEVGVRGPVGLAFAQKMQAGGVESRWHSDPPLPGRFAWDGLTLWFWPESGLEAGREYRFWLEGGAQAQDGQVLRREVRWTIRVRAMELLYLSPAAVGSELWRSSAGGGQPRQLSHSGNQVLDFGVAASGEWIVYAARNSAQGSDLWVMRRDGSEAHSVCNCGGDRCRQAAWSPDGRWIAYSRTRLAVVKGESYAPMPRIWTLEMASGKTAALFTDPAIGGTDPIWSPDGRRLAFFDEPGRVVHVLEIETGKQWMLPSRLGTAAGWTANGAELWYGDLETSETLPFGSAYRADVLSGQVERLFTTLPDPEDYGLPAPTPNGAWVAVGVRFRGGSHSVQLVLMRPDGSERQAITDDHLFTHGAYRWDVSGSELVYQQLEIASSSARPEIWVWNRASGAARRIASNAALPAWLP
jgi:Tol biopolymer transport system component